MAISIGKNTEFMGGYPTKNDNYPYFSYICPANKTIHRYEKSF